GAPPRAFNMGAPPQRGEPGDRLYVVGEWPGIGGNRRQGHAAGGRDQRRLLCADRVHLHRHLPVPHPRTLRHGGHAGDGPIPRRAAMRFDALEAVLLIPLMAAALLAALPGYRLTAGLNVAAALLTFLAAASLFVVQPASGDYLLVDDLNKVFIVLTTFVAFTTSVVSASYIGHEL